jgi:ligand-binding SRPBCC domain-containing protein
LFARTYSLDRVQTLRMSLDDCWAFFSNPLNLERITPPSLGFNPLDRDFQRMYAGMILRYTVTPLLGIRLSWMTEITHVEPMKFFVDEQRFGPYLFWHHQHHFEEVPGGVRMRDLVHYALPYGPIGWLMHAVLVRRQLTDIFDFRRRTLAELFGEITEPSTGSATG